MGSEALVVCASVGKREDIDKMFKEVTEKWGRVDVLVNNAGDDAAGAGKLWRFSVNVLVVFRCRSAQHFELYVFKLS